MLLVVRMAEAQTAASQNPYTARLAKVTQALLCKRCATETRELTNAQLRD
jgi:hypothetical protein